MDSQHFEALISETRREKILTENAAGRIREYLKNLEPLVFPDINLSNVIPLPAPMYEVMQAGIRQFNFASGSPEFEGALRLVSSVAKPGPGVPRGNPMVQALEKFRPRRK